MSHSIALNLKRISLENELISLRQLHNFHSNRYKKVTSTLTATELAIHFGQGKSSELAATRWSGDVIKRTGHKDFNAVSHNRARPEVLFSNLTWRSRGQMSSVLLPLLLFAFSIRKCVSHGEWSFTFWQWKYGRKFGVKELDALDRWCWCWKSHHAVEL